MPITTVTMPMPVMDVTMDVTVAVMSMAVAVAVAVTMSVTMAVTMAVMSMAVAVTMSVTTSMAVTSERRVGRERQSAKDAWCGQMALEARLASPVDIRGVDRSHDGPCPVREGLAGD
ncbi:MAG: hypothetical protein ACRD3W_14140 [Terriglobales bacterium]